MAAPDRAPAAAAAETGPSALEELARCIRLLALNIGRYQSSYGELPREAVVAQLHVPAADGAQARLLANGIDALVSVLEEAARPAEEGGGASSAADCRL